MKNYFVCLGAILLLFIQCGCSNSDNELLSLTMETSINWRISVVPPHSKLLYLNSNRGGFHGDGTEYFVLQYKDEVDFAEMEIPNTYSDENDTYVVTRGDALNDEQFSQIQSIIENLEDIPSTYQIDKDHIDNYIEICSTSKYRPDILSDDIFYILQDAEIKCIYYLQKFL